MIASPSSEKSLKFSRYIPVMNHACAILTALLFCFAPARSSAQEKQKVAVPDWALPSSPTHKQVPPPPDFHRPTKTKKTKIGIFEGKSDVGGALVPGSSSFDAATGKYIINSAGYNIWYTRDEFHYLWKKMSGDVSLSADISFPDTAGFFDRKCVVIIRQSLEDDSREAMVALHGGGLMHLAWRPETGASLKEMRIDKRGALRIGIEKKGDSFTAFISMNGEPMKQATEPVQLHLDGPFYVGIGYCSHLPATVDTGVLSNVVLENEAGKM